MKVEYSYLAEDKLVFMNLYERKKVEVWFEYLKDWKTSEFVQSNSVKLNVQGREEYLLRTTSEWRIFYTVDLEKDTVTVVDFTTQDTLLAFGGAKGGAT